MSSVRKLLENELENIKFRINRRESIAADLQREAFQNFTELTNLKEKKKEIEKHLESLDEIPLRQE